MSGRRVHSRFKLHGSAGRMRISRDVEVVPGSTANSDVYVLSDAPPVVGELLTLVLVSRTREMECAVKVIDTRPHVSDGVLRHLVRLELVAAPSATDRAVVSGPSAINGTLTELES